MAPVVQECPICLDRFRDPVVTPCGHLSCEACMGTHVRASQNPYEATCPTCRAPFPIVTPNMALIPKKYHVFISPSLRRVYLGEGEDTSRVVINGLNAEITLLKARVGTLKRDKDLLMDRCEAAQSTASCLAADERAARLELASERQEVRHANMAFELLKAEHRSLKYMHSRCPPDTKRKSNQAALDSSTSIDSPSSSPRKPKDILNGRPVKPMPKRARLQPTTTGLTAQVPPSPIATRLRNREGARSLDLFSSPSSSSSSPSPSVSAAPSVASATDRPSGFTYGDGSITFAAIRARVARDRYATSSSGGSDESDVGSFVSRYRTRSQSALRRLSDFGV